MNAAGDGGDDPYAPPGGIATEAAERRAALREIVVGWEKLRVIYNLALLVPGLGLLALYLAEGLMPVSIVISGALVVAVGANVAFFLGPLVELYVRGLLRDGESIGKGRMLIFSAGLVVSAGVFVLALLAV